VKVIRANGYSEATLLVEGEEMEVTDMKATEIMKGVYVSCGVPKIAREGGVTLPRLVIDAPLSVVILREELYGKPRPPKKAKVHHSGSSGFAGEGEGNLA
jgi:sRNA-binding carbon storage regulator CsrA